MDPDFHDVVAAILVRDGRVLLCHRHPNRQWYPNVWDVPGGHIEVGESPGAALRRELAEELGIEVELDSPDPCRILQLSSHLRLRLWVITEWSGEIENRAREEHDDIAWFRTDQVQRLDVADERLVELLVNALEECAPSTLHGRAPNGTVRRHLTIVLGETAVPDVARLRHQWDPVMASGVPPHLTVVYPEEVTDFELLLERARHILPQVPAFRMRLGSAIAIEDGAGGVFVEAHDDSGSLASLRSTLLAPPCESRELRAHVTVVHARTSTSGYACWQQLKGWSANGEVAVTEIAFTHTGPVDGMRIQETFALR